MKTFFENLIQKFRSKSTTVKIINIIFVVLAIIAGVYAHGAVAKFTKEMTILDLPGAPVIKETQDDTEATQEVLEETVGEATIEPWDGNSPVNILFLGLDFRDWESGDTPRSDTMILFTVNPANDTAGMLSIPRDLWVNIPSFGYYKINEAYFLGENARLPGGGPALAVETVEQFLGVPIQYYAQVDFLTFIDIIDEIGGILITPPVDVKVEEMGSVYDQVLKAGEQYTLPGSLALSYARNRYTGDGDFGRAQRQQQVIQAILDRILQYDQLPNLIAKAPNLYAELSSGIRTNLDLSTMIKLGTLVLNIPTESFQKEVIGTDRVIMTKSPTGLDILKPIPDKIRQLRDQIFSASGGLGPVASSTEGSTLAKDEAASIAIMNGTSMAGLETRTVEYLQSQGLNAAVATPNQSGVPTTIYIYNSKPHTVAYLANIMNVASTNIRFAYDPSMGVDVVVVLGGDWAGSNPMP